MARVAQRRFYGSWYRSPSWYRTLWSIGTETFGQYDCKPSEIRLAGGRLCCSWYRRLTWYRRLWSVGTEYLLGSFQSYRVSVAERFQLSVASVDLIRKRVGETQNWVHLYLTAPLLLVVKGMDEPEKSQSSKDDQTRKSRLSGYHTACIISQATSAQSQTL